MPILPLGEWAPDLGELVSDQLMVAEGVYPVANGYAPWPGFVPLPGVSAPGVDFLAGLAGRTPSGSGYAFGASASALYRLAGSALADVSKPGGYSTTALDDWELIQVGQRVLATNFSNPIQSFDLSRSQAFADLSKDAPRARHLSEFYTHVIAGHIVDPQADLAPNRIQWSGQADPTAWPLPGTNEAADKLAGARDLPQQFGAITGLAFPGDYGFVAQERAISRADFVGSPLVFKVRQVDTARGVYAAGSVVVAKRSVYYMAEDGFYRFNGLQSEPIGSQRINQFVLDDLDAVNLSRVEGTVHDSLPLIVWAYPGAGNVGGRPNRLLIYHLDLNRFSLITEDTALGGSVDIGALIRVGTPATSIDDPTLGVLDSQPGLILDSLVGGEPMAGAFSSDGTPGTFSGAAVPARLRTGLLQLGDGRRSTLRGVRMISDTLPASITIRGRSTPSDTTVAGTPVLAAAATNDVFPMLENARYHGLEAAWDAGWTGTIRGVEADWTDGGRH